MPTAQVDATQNPLARVHSGARHLAMRFSRLVVDGRVHHIIVSIERIAAPRVVPHTIEVPVLNEDTFAKRLAGRNRHAAGTQDGRRWLRTGRHGRSQTGAAKQAAIAPSIAPARPHPPTLPPMLDRRIRARPARCHRRFPAVGARERRARRRHHGRARADHDGIRLRPDRRQDAEDRSAVADAETPRRRDRDDAPLRRGQHLATTITSPDVVHAKPPDPAPSPDRSVRDHRSARCAPERSAQGNHAHRRRAARDVPGRSARQGRPAARHHQTAGARAAGVPRKARADPRAHPRRACARRATAAAVGLRTRRTLRGRARAVCATNKPCQATTSCRWPSSSTTC